MANANVSAPFYLRAAPSRLGHRKRYLAKPMKIGWSLRSLLFATFCVAAVLSCQLYVERLAKGFELQLSALDESTQSQLMQGSDSLTVDTRTYSISDLQTARQGRIVNFLCFRRALSVNFRSTNYVRMNTSQSWTHAQNYVVRVWGIQLESNQSTCDVVEKLAP